MLAKMWKKVLFAICIVACIFNIMSKLVNRHSLRENLESANDGITVFDIFKKDEVKVSESEEFIDGVIESIKQETNTTVTENKVVEGTVVENTTATENTTPAETTNKEDEVVTEEPKKEDKTFSFSDFTIIF